jgi:hypothetical protein
MVVKSSILGFGRAARTRLCHCHYASSSLSKLPCPFSLYRENAENAQPGTLHKMAQTIPLAKIEQNHCKSHHDASEAVEVFMIPSRGINQSTILITPTPVCP